MVLERGDGRAGDKSNQGKNGQVVCAKSMGFAICWLLSCHLAMLGGWVCCGGGWGNGWGRWCGENWEWWGLRVEGWVIFEKNGCEKKSRRQKAKKIQQPLTPKNENAWNPTPFRPHLYPYCFIPYLKSQPLVIPLLSSIHPTNYPH